MIAPNGTTYVDNSTLRATHSCETQAALRYILGYTTVEDSVWLYAGTATHDVLAEYFRQTLDAKTCLRKFEMLYRGYSEDNGLDDLDNSLYRVSWTNTAAVLGTWFEQHPLSSFPFTVKPGMVEVGFEYPLTDECVCGHSERHHDPERGCAYRGRCGCTEYRPAFVYWGRADLIVQSNHDGSIYVGDHKTAKSITTYWTDKFRLDSQMSSYTWGAQRNLGMPVAGVYINAIEFSKLPSTPSRKCKDHGVVYAECGPLHAKSQLLIYSRTPDQIDAWHTLAVKKARQYRDLASSIKTVDDCLQLTSLEGTLNNSCGFCDFKPFCQTGRKPEDVETMLVYSPWRPY